MKKSKTKAKDKIKQEISKIEKELKKINLKFPEQTKLEEKSIKKLNFDEVKSPDTKEEEKINQKSEFEQEIIDFPAPVLTSERKNPESLEQTALDAPSTPISRTGAENLGYVGSQSSYLSGSAGYTGNQKYRSGVEAYSNQEFKPESNRSGFDKPIFGARAPERRINEGPGFFSQNRAQESQNQEQPRAMAQYEIKTEETSHHGIRKNKDIFS